MLRPGDRITGIDGMTDGSIVKMTYRDCAGRKRNNYAVEER
jgi:hypothetical protein